jgi:hypothetical protein
MPFSREIAGKSGAGQGARGEKKEIPPSQSTGHTILCSQGDCGPELHNDPQDCCNGEEQKHDGTSDDAAHIQPISMVASIGIRSSLS